MEILSNMTFSEYFNFIKILKNSNWRGFWPNCACSCVVWAWIELSTDDILNVLPLYILDDRDDALKKDTGKTFANSHDQGQIFKFWRHQNDFLTSCLSLRILVFVHLTYLLKILPEILYVFMQSNILNSFKKKVISSSS